MPFLTDIRAVSPRGVFKRAGPTPTAHPTNTVHTIALGVAPEAGDIMMLVQVATATTRLINPGGGWNRLFDGSALCHILWKVADGSEGLTLVLNTNVATGVACYMTYVFRGGVSVEAAWAQFGRNPPNLAPVGGLKEYFWLCGVGSASAWASVTAYPAGYSNGLLNGAGPTVATCERGQLLAASEDPATFSSTLTPSSVYTVAVVPP